MASSPLPADPPYESTAELWFELLRRREQVPRSRLVRLARWLRLNRKPVALTLAFWTAYAIGYAWFITR